MLVSDGLKAVVVGHHGRRKEALIPLVMVDRERRRVEREIDVY